MTFCIIGSIKIVLKAEQIRVNAICPAIVDTQMTVSIIDVFKETKQAINTPEDIAKYIIGLEVSSMNGKAIYGKSSNYCRSRRSNVDSVSQSRAVEDGKLWMD